MKIEVLFPEFCNLYGDLSNIHYLKKCIPDVEVIETSYNSEPAFLKEKINLIYMGPMSENSQELVLKKIAPYKEKIEELIKNNVVFLFTGNSLELLGKFIEQEDGTKIECLNIFDIYTKRNMLNRLNSNVLGTFDDIEIVGFQSQFTTMHGNNDNYFLNLKLGLGCNNSKYEGIRKNNFIGTTVIGPILILNPLFTKKILKMMGVKNIKLETEEEVLNAYNARLEEFYRKFIK